jgi:hypothetical protein
MIEDPMIQAPIALVWFLTLVVAFVVAARRLPRDADARKPNPPVSDSARRFPALGGHRTHRRSSRRTDATMQQGASTCKGHPARAAARERFGQSCRESVWCWPRQPFGMPLGPACEHNKICDGEQGGRRTSDRREFSYFTQPS